MLARFRRGRQDPVGQPVASEDTGDSPEALHRAVHELVWFVNRSSGRLPNDVVVASREVTDTLSAIISTSANRDLDIHAVIAVKAIATDYLPTTLRAYLALDTLTETDSHRVASELRQQVESLWEAAADVLAASVAQDVDALMTQGNFLRTKFTRSDLDL